MEAERDEKRGRGIRSHSGKKQKENESRQEVRKKGSTDAEWDDHSSSHRLGGIRGLPALIEERSIDRPFNYC